MVGAEAFGGVLGGWMAGLLQRVRREADGRGWRAKL